MIYISKGKQTSTEFLIEELYKLKWNDPNVTFREVIRTLYIDEKKSCRDIAKMFLVGVSKVHCWLLDNGIDPRSKIRWK